MLKKGIVHWRRAFTLIELLLVIALIGVMTAIVLPRFSTAMSGGRLSVAVRLLARTGRYARTMALLHQSPVDLVVRFDPPLLRVEAAQPDIVEEDDPGFLRDGESEEAGFPRDDLFSDTGDFGAKTKKTDTGEAFSKAIRIRHELEKVSIEFLGYEDTFGTGMDNVDESEIRIRYRSNGTCRPHGWRIVDERGITREIRIDVVGSFAITEATDLIP